MDKLPQRKNIRLKDYDYSQAGYYFITICNKDKKNLFWSVGETFGLQFGKPILSNIGESINKEINKINFIYENVEINKYVIMPNHIHMIIILHGESGRQRPPLQYLVLFNSLKVLFPNRLDFCYGKNHFMSI